MNFKIIETDYLYPDILLYRNRDEEGNEMVNILTIGEIEGDTEMFAGETISFENHQSAKNFIRDFSKESANEWCKENKISY